jgi:glycosyltransferase involved in cell wall biosynthesis
MRKKPILYISPLPPPQGGIAVWTKKILGEGLPDGNPIALVDTKIRGSRNIFDAVFFSFAEVFRTTRIIGSLLYQLIFNNPKLIHLNCSLSVVGVFRDLICVKLAKLFRLPVVIHYHGNVQDFQSNRCRGLSGYALRELVKDAAINIVANTPSQQKLQLLYANSPDKILLLPNFIEDKIFEFEKPDKSQHKTRPRAIFGGGITAAKGCAEILTIATQLPTIDFHLFGKMHTDMAPAFQNCPPNIFLHGEVKHDVLLNEMCMSDFLLFPSYTEGFPLTVLEAMSIGIPIIATNVGGIPEMVSEGKGGFLVAPRDVNALLTAIQKMFDHPEQMMVMGKYNKQKSFDRYRYSLVIARLLTIYNKILQEP